MAVTLMTVAEYARHRGCDEKAVRKALQEGRITRISAEKRCIDPEVADIQWAKNTRARGDSGTKAKPPGGTVPPAGGEGAGTGEDYTSMRARRERAEAMMAEIELAKASGTVLDRESSIRAIYTKFRELRDDAGGLGRRLAPQLAAMRDEREIRIAVDRAVAECFASFAARAMQGLADRLHGKPTTLPPEVLQAPSVHEGPSA